MFVQAGQQQRCQALGLVGILGLSRCGHVVQAVGDKRTQHAGGSLQPLGEGLTAAVSAPLGVSGQHQALDVVLHIHIQAVLQALIVLIACAVAGICAAAIAVTAAAASAAAAAAVAGAGEGGHHQRVGFAQCEAVATFQRRGAACAHQIQRQALEAEGVVLGRGRGGHAHTLGPVDRVIRVTSEVAAALDAHRAACAALGLGAVVAGGSPLTNGDRIVVRALRPVVLVFAGAAVHAPGYLAAGKVGQRSVFAAPSAGELGRAAGKVVGVCDLIFTFTDSNVLTFIIGKAVFDNAPGSNTVSLRRSNHAKIAGKRYPGIIAPSGRSTVHNNSRG